MPSKVFNNKKRTRRIRQSFLSLSLRYLACERRLRPRSALMFARWSRTKWNWELSPLLLYSRRNDRRYNDRRKVKIANRIWSSPVQKISRLHPRFSLLFALHIVLILVKTRATRDDECVYAAVRRTKRNRFQDCSFGKFQLNKFTQQPGKAKEF